MTRRRRPEQQIILDEVAAAVADLREHRHREFAP